MKYQYTPTAWVALVMGSALALGSAHAQTVAPDAAQQLQNLNKTTFSNDFGNAPKILQDVQTRKKLTPPKASNVTVDVLGFKVTGITEAPSFDVRKVLAEHIGPKRTFDQLETAAEALQIALRQDGYFLAQVDIPQQSAQSGQIELRVVQGYLDNIEVKLPQSGINTSKAFIEAMLAASLKQGQVIHVKQVERALFLVGDMAGVRAESVIEPGKAPGTAKIIVTVNPGRETEGSVDFDNYGSRFTGEFRVSGATTFNAPANRGDSFKLSAMVTTNLGAQFLRAAYQTPVGSSGLKLGAAFSTLNYKLGTATFTPLKASGVGSVTTLFALYPAARSRNFNSFLQASLNHGTGQDKQESVGVENKSHSDSLSFSIVGDSRDSLKGGGINNFSAGATFGSIGLDTATALAADQSAFGRHIQGSYSKFTYGFIRQQFLWADPAQPASRVVLYTSLQGQMAGKNLSSGEKMSLGGPTGVRAYAGGEATGDNAHIFTWELRKNILGENVNGDLVFTVFGDYGYSLTNKTMLSTDAVRSNNIAGHGVGVNWSSRGGTTLKLSIASRGPKYVPVGDPEDRLPRIYFSLNKQL